MDQDISISHSTQEKNKNIIYNLKTQGLHIICTNLIYNLYKSDTFDTAKGFWILPSPELKGLLMLYTILLPLSTG